MNRSHPDELISAAVSGELSAEERGALDEHLASCPGCRQTLADFTDQRRLLGGMRREPAPSGLAERVQHGIATGARTALPWWRRPRGLAALGAAGVLILMLGTAVGLAVRGPSDSDDVGAVVSEPPLSTASASPSPLPTEVPPEPVPTATLAATAPPGVAATPAATPVPAPVATPTPEPRPAGQPIAYFSWTRDESGTTASSLIDPVTAETIVDLPSLPGPVVAAAVSSDREWVAFISGNGLSGLQELYAYRLARNPDERTLVHLGESVAGTPFLERLAWSPEGRFVAYTLMDPQTGDVDAWHLDTQGDLVPRQVTAYGDAFAAAFDPTFRDENDLRLWISRAGNTPRTERYVVAPGMTEVLGRVDDAMVWDDVFLPLPNADGSRTLFWQGRMAESDQWVFREGGMPYLTGSLHEFGTDDEGTPVFSTLAADRDAFGYAAFDWSPDGVTFAVWNAYWTGVGQGPDGDFPDATRVYMSTADDPELITPSHALDRADIPPDTYVRHVALAPDGRHLALTLQGPGIGGFGDDPIAELRLVTRNLGTTPDEVEILGEPERWNGPALYRAQTAP